MPWFMKKQQSENVVEISILARVLGNDQVELSRA